MMMKVGLIYCIFFSLSKKKSILLLIRTLIRVNWQHKANQYFNTSASHSLCRVLTARQSSKYFEEYGLIYVFVSNAGFEDLED